MSTVSELDREVREFFREYVNSDVDWHGTVEKLCIDPYSSWNDTQWDLWNKLNDEYEGE